jgi:hypothetical protein
MAVAAVGSALVTVPLLLGAGCSAPAEVNVPDSGPTAPEPSAVPSTASHSTTGPTGTQVGSLAGSWTSASCGERKYVRQIELAADGTFSAADLVSPCPPGAACVWSGIVYRRGTYSVAGGTVTLTPAAAGGPQGKPFPATLGLDPATGAPFEADGNGATCPYERRPAQP